MYETILFDLDGTLTDPGIGITNSVAHALKKYGINVTDRAELYKFIGPPLLDSFMDFCGFSPERAKEAIGFYREYFSDRGIFENEVYPEIPKLLAALTAAGKHLLVATSKPELYARQILEHFSLDGYFSFIAGSDMEGTRSKKADVIRYALSHAGISDLSKTVMVGDRKHDILGAAEVGMDSVGVLFGYGSRAELDEAGATYIAKNPEELGRILTANHLPLN